MGNAPTDRRKQPYRFLRAPTDQTADPPFKLSLATCTRPGTGAVNMDVRTIFPFHSISRGSPTLTDTTFMAPRIAISVNMSPASLSTQAVTRRVPDADLIDFPVGRNSAKIGIRITGNSKFPRTVSDSKERRSLVRRVEKAPSCDHSGQFVPAICHVERSRDISGFF